MGHTLSVAKLHKPGSDYATDLLLGSLPFCPAPSLKHKGMPLGVTEASDFLLSVHLGSDFILLLFFNKFIYKSFPL